MIWIIGLIVLAFVLLFLEIFVPGGLLGMLAAACILGAGYIAFTEYGLAIATFITVGSIALACLMFFIEIKLLKASGRYISVDNKITSSSVKRADASAIVGKCGVALTTLSPGGKVRVEGKDYEASSISGLLKKGQSIEVVRVEAFKIIIKKT
ncbi:NfeD family protein [Rubellicoccus peritrichatus]|uniref:NfeD family protein n=1 Tax=Rubellicoccus peritrichatus TaxID=3080537 RepID=A0AAQ3LAW4_9BACT|nr:NfeD family protein [Puniceicoccus sp. CR14]WOO42470.1 NfeD family protein [Puniceicoccus sp. CR14]